MFVGHSFLAFAIMGLVAVRFGRSRSDAIALAVVAALFAATPDVDILFALPGLLSSSPIADFWAASTVTHRAITHSIPVAVAIGMLSTVGMDRAPVTAAIGLAALVGLVGFTVGPLPGAVTAVFVLGVVGVSAVGTRVGISEGWLAVAAGVGLASHPFGDLFTGIPPAMLWPVPVRLLDGRIAPLADPTLDFLLAFGAELTAIWAGTMVALWLLEPAILPRLHTCVRRRAVIGAAYAGAILVLPQPTVDYAYPFVFSVLPVGMVGIERRLPSDSLELFNMWVTGLAAVTIAVTAYAVAYLLPAF